MTASLLEPSGSGASPSSIGLGRQHAAATPQRKISELERANLNLRMELAERERQFSRVLVDGKIDEKVISEFIARARSLGDVQSQLRNAESELAEARQKAADLERQREQQAQVEEELRARLSKQTARLSSLSQSQSSNSPGATRQLAVLKLENSKLKQECADQEAKNAELTVQLCELQSKLDDHEHDGIRVDAGAARLRTQLQEAHANVSKAELENRRLVDEIDHLKAELLAASGRLKKQTQASERQIRDVGRALRERASRFEQRLRKSNAAVASGFETVSKRFDTLRETNLRKIERSEARWDHLFSECRNVVARLSKICADLVKIGNVPEPNLLVEDPSTLEFFVGRVRTAAEVQEVANRSGMRKLERLANANRSARHARNVLLSPAVSKVVENVQETVAEMTKVLHSDHKQLIGALTADDDAAFADLD
jgi:hypothetical protein